ncbi:hypothetical protein PC129_g23573 [Phytophthora cactorum]|uniref:Uncharacterized protein n=1 Tax=Phytophthora cactorum TaxID=29920 RepID=A0A8T1JM54_9STRA|nr:hypothetical protein PC114_g25422 [Phytophthora cactorum]KAG2956559.1 hypothetical protein PC118_g24411 [Phytophthora cactorum]KAG2958638.1 hypothetical protein PC119_g26955 [Phytophthora cactorum]KAG2962592.1 hypothetical protein PC120_g27654 [Phytophthora cactorum]KAG3126179.1 hypothetical protein C6341_g25478 [Phytophthora cactorum]
MDDVTAAILAVVLGACVSAVVAAADKRCPRQPPKAPMAFKVHAFESNPWDRLVPQEATLRQGVVPTNLRAGACSMESRAWP